MSGVLELFPKVSRPYRCDPRIAVLLALIGIILCKSLEQFGQLAILECSLLLIALGRRIPLSSFLLRSLLVLPFSLAALPLIFTVEGELWFRVWELTATWQGLERFLVIVLHCWLCYQCLLLACAAVGPFAFIEALGRLGLPRRLVGMLGLALRYLDLLTEEAARMNRARLCRGCGSRSTLLQSTKETGQLIGSLFLRTLDRVERVHLAMQCRGDGRPPVSKTSHPAPWTHWAAVWVFALFTIWVAVPVA
jgi:cobalt/nickel transport system permease protein